MANPESLSHPFSLATHTFSFLSFNWTKTKARKWFLQRPGEWFYLEGGWHLCLEKGIWHRGFWDASLALCIKWRLLCDFNKLFQTHTHTHVCDLFSLLYSQQNILKHRMSYIVYLILLASPQFHVRRSLSNVSLILGGNELWSLILLDSG